MTIVKSTSKNVPLPSEVPLTDEEIVSLIRKTEKGPFHSSEYVKEQIAKWKKEHVK
jgi:hypothetical protein